MLRPAPRLTIGRCISIADCRLPTAQCEPRTNRCSAVSTMSPSPCRISRRQVPSIATRWALRSATPQALPEHGVTVVFIDTGNSKIELLEPLGRGVADRGLPRQEPVGRHAPYLLRGRRHPGRARSADSRLAPACSATARRRSARMASRCCSCIPRISRARWSNWSRREQMNWVSASRSSSSSGGWCCSPCCPSACGRRTRKATTTLGTVSSAPRGAASAARRAPHDLDLARDLRVCSMWSRRGLGLSLRRSAADRSRVPLSGQTGVPLPIAILLSTGRAQAGRDGCMPENLHKKNARHEALLF